MSVMLVTWRFLPKLWWESRLVTSELFYVNWFDYSIEFGDLKLMGFIHLIKILVDM